MHKSAQQQRTADDNKTREHYNSQQQTKMYMHSQYFTHRITKLNIMWHKQELTIQQTE